MSESKSKTRAKKAASADAVVPVQEQEARSTRESLLVNDTPDVETRAETQPVAESPETVTAQAPIAQKAPDIVWDYANQRWVDRSELPPAAPTRRKRVAIVGFAPHWIEAPFDDEDVEIWSLNEFYDVAPSQLLKPRQEGRLRWFEIHVRETEYEGNPFLHSRNKSNEHAAKLAALGCPVYMHRQWHDIPNSVPYPKDAIIAKYGRYFTNSISWMLALAIEEGFTEIGLYGVDMATNTEYGYERPSCEYVLGWVRALGIRLVMPESCDLIKSAFLYGFEVDRASFARKKLEKRVEEVRARRHHVENQMEALRNTQMQLLGAEENTKYIREILIGNLDPRRAPQAEE